MTKRMQPNPEYPGYHSIVHNYYSPTCDRIGCKEMER